MKITGNIALVTGGASGLGLAAARKLHAAGASVVILDLPSSNGTAVAKELGARAAFAAGDVTSPDDVNAALDAAGALAGACRGSWSTAPASAPPHGRRASKARSRWTRSPGWSRST